VKLRKVLALASSFAALSLGACSTTMMTTAERGRPAPQASASVAGTYLAANFAAAQGDVRAATGFYANSLKDDPANADLLERTFLFAAEAGEEERRFHGALGLDPDPHVGLGAREARRCTRQYQHNACR